MNIKKESTVSSDKFQPVSLDQLYFIFYILIIGLIFAFLINIYENWMYLQNYKKNKNLIRLS